VSRGLGPRLLAELSSVAATCSLAPDLTSLLRWAPALPCVPWIQVLHPREESSGAVTCSSAPDLASLPRWAPTLPHGPNLASPRGGLWCYHIPHGSSELWTTGIKKGLAAPDTELGSYVSKARSRVTEAPARRVDRPLQFDLIVQCRPSSPLLHMATVMI
jgi:hypothetical protein